MKIISVFGLLTLLALMGGCAANPATEAYQHTPAVAQKVDNMIVINKSFEQAWNDMIKRMTVTQYRINNIEKASRIINLEFQADTPADVEKYIDCGASTRVITYKDKPRKFEYKITDSKPYEAVEHNKYYYWYNVSPHTNMRGTVNVYMSPLGGNQTEVSVNARYVLTREFSGTYYTQRLSGEYLEKGNFHWDPRRVTLTTMKPGIYKEKPFVQCVSRGVLEKEFLNYARE